MDAFEITDSGTRKEFGTGAVRDAQTGKGRFDLLPPEALSRLAKHFEGGALKYADRNWEKGIPMSRFMDSGIRHAFQFLAGADDEDHLAAAAWNFMCAIETEHRVDDGRLSPALLDLPRYKYDARVIARAEQWAESIGESLGIPCPADCPCEDILCPLEYEEEDHGIGEILVQ